MTGLRALLAAALSIAVIHLSRGHSEWRLLALGFLVALMIYVPQRLALFRPLAWTIAGLAGVRLIYAVVFPDASRGPKVFDFGRFCVRDQICLAAELDTADLVRTGHDLLGLAALPVAVFFLASVVNGTSWCRLLARVSGPLTPALAPWLLLPDAWLAVHRDNRILRSHGLSSLGVRGTVRATVSEAARRAETVERGGTRA